MATPCGFLSLYDFAAAQAGCANAHAFSGRAHFGVNRPQIDVPAPLAHVVRVADGVAAHRLLAANLTNLCHLDCSPESVRTCCANDRLYGI